MYKNYKLKKFISRALVLGIMTTTLGCVSFGEDEKEDLSSSDVQILGISDVEIIDEDEIISVFVEKNFECLEMENKIIINKYIGNALNIIIPNKIREKLVTKIGNNVFRNCKSLRTIKIPASVISIGDGAFFGCENLSKVIFEEGSQLMGIGGYAFEGCESLGKIEIPASVKRIKESVFGRCENLKEVIFAEGSQLTKIEKYTFVWCKLLGEIKIPISVKSIGDGAFKGCISLTKITIPTEVKTIGWGVFFECEQLEEVIFAKNSKLTKIGNQAFSGCKLLGKIEIPAGVKTIGWGAFNRCKLLQREDLQTMDGQPSAKKPKT